MRFLHPKLLFLFFLTSISISVMQTLDATESTEKPLLIIGTENNAPFSFILPDGTISGLYVEFWRLWSVTNNIPIKIQLTDFNTSLQKTKNTNTLHMGLFKSAERVEWASFTSAIHHVDTGILYNRKYEKFKRLINQPHLRVSVQENTFQSDFLNNTLPDLNLTYYDEINIGFNQLLNNNVDAIIAEIPALKNQVNRRGLNGVFHLSSEILISNLVHGIIAKHQPKLLSMINEGILQIPHEQLVALEKRWFPDNRPFFNDSDTANDLTNDEKIWLTTHNTFSIGIEQTWRPVEFADKKGHHSGITADFLDYISKDTKIRFNPNLQYAWADAFEALKKGDIDIMPGVVNTPERAKDMSFSDSFFEVHMVIVLHKDSDNIGSLASLVDKKLAVVRGYVMNDFIKNDYPNANILAVDSVLDGLKKLQEGKIDAFIGTLPVIIYEKNKHQLHNVFVAGYAPYKLRLSVAVRKGLEPLVGIINKSLAKIDVGQRSAIVNKWLAVHVQRGTNIKDFLLWSLPILIVFFLVIFFFARINAKLKKEIITREIAETQRELLENQLTQSHKMEALGQLVGGISHDFNNILGIILGYTELLIRKHPNEDNLTNYLTEINHAAKRGSNMTSKLLSYSRKQAVETVEVNLNQLLEHQKNMLEKTLTVRINLVMDLTPDLWPVLLDKNEFEDALLNICINAMQAMSEKTDRAKLKIRTSNIELEESQAKVVGLVSGDYIQVNISDNGCGMDKVLLDKIFDPFFSTKEEKGTGLGLSQVYGFVQRSFGSIKVYSEPNIGTQFILFFPRHTKLVVAESPEKNASQSTNTGNESILIVDDEEALCALAAEILSQKGYKTVTACSAAQALQLLESQDFNLVLSDIIMPNMDGHQLAKIIHDKYPAIKVQLMTGFTDKAHDPSNKLLAKPYEAEELCLSIRNLLDS